MPNTTHPNSFNAAATLESGAQEGELLQTERA